MHLRIRNISKTYPNGAGKSTLIRMIATLQEPDEGSIPLGELDVLRRKDGVRKTLGYLTQEFGVYPKVSAEDLLDHFAVLKGIAERRARKVVIDTAGVETLAPMDDWVEIGVFDSAEEGGELGEPLYVQKHRIRSGEQTITVTMPRKPVLAGIDPCRWLYAELNPRLVEDADEHHFGV